MNHFINFKDFSPDYLEGIIDQALAIKHHPAQYATALDGKIMYMLFQKTSTRTALSFALGIKALGGGYLIQVDIIMARLKTNQDLILMAKYATVPVINGCCNMYHPSQAIADLVTIKELFGSLQIKLLYIGVRNNVLNSLMESLPQLGGELFAAAPVINEPSIDKDLYETAAKTGRFHDIGGGNPMISEVQKLIKEVDAVYTDTWIDMEFTNDPVFAGLKEERVKKMLPFQVNNELLKGSKALVLHDMPIHAGYEISRETVEANIKNILQQADNRKYAAQSILLSLLK